jgi:hypothetical protein
MQTLIVVGAIFAVGGALFFGLGLFLARANRRFDRAAQKASGEVVDVRWQSRSGLAAGGVQRIGYPVLRFTLPDGGTVETVARTTTSADVMQRGRPVSVLYDPTDPRKARIDSGPAAAGPALMTVGFMVLGGVFLVLGLALIAGGIALDDALPDA